MNRPQAPAGLSPRPGKLIAIPAVAAALLVGGLPGQGAVADAHPPKAGAKHSNCAKPGKRGRALGKATQNKSGTDRTTGTGNAPAGGGAGRKIR